MIARDAINTTYTIPSILNRRSTTFENNKHTTTMISQTNASREDLLYVIFPPSIRSIGGVKKLASNVGNPMKNTPKIILSMIEEKMVVPPSID